MKQISIEKKKSAFTLIEVIVSVSIVSIIVLGAMKLQDRNREMAIYIKKRGENELDNSLFLTSEIFKYNKSKKSAYDILIDEFKLNDESKNILKEIKKSINISEDTEIPIKMNDDAQPIFTFYTNSIMLKDKYPARYFSFK
jgi:prepilin-type N-terminal cleavage/methylation domain-containing protein